MRAPRCLVFKFNNLTELQDIRNKMSATQTLMYSPNATALVLLTIISIFTTLGAGMLITWLNVVNERRRLILEDLRSKARRLRHVSTKLSVHAPPILAHDEDPDGPAHFHIFLSHVWGTGQDQSTRAAPHKPRRRALCLSPLTGAPRASALV